MSILYDAGELERLRARCAVQPHRMKLFLNDVFKKMYPVEQALDRLPPSAQALFFAAGMKAPLELVDRRDSALDGATKLVFRATDGALIESVLLRPATGRTSLCISSQVGCACGCVFCATGGMGFVRNLTVAEMLDQVAQAGRLARGEGRVIRNVVFMGMGEPLLNFDHLCDALDFLCAVPFFNFAPSRLMVSTVGIPAAMQRFVQRHPRVQLALSLHSARPAVRESLMPQARHSSLSELRDALVAVAQQGGTVMVEYLMLAGVNDGEADLQALIAYLRGLPVHINLIPYNAHAGCRLAGTDRSGREQFANALKAAGFSTTLRYSLGADIAAACGQLVQEGMKERGE